MPAKFSDEDIAKLFQERKQLSRDFRQQIRLRNKRGHKEREVDIPGAEGNHFKLILRQADFNQFDFSIILAVYPKETTQVFRLRRYNGKSHEHTNQIEKDTFYDFHVHTATQRYQELGLREDSFAEPTSRFSDFHSALGCMLEDGGFDTPPNSQLSLFEGV